MRIARRLGLVLLTVCAFSALAVSSASASVFLAHPPGTLLSAAAATTQVFITPAGSVECTALKLLPPDTTTALEALHILVRIDYEKCKVFGALNAVVHPALYLISADGLVLLENTILILAPPNCVITVPGNQDLNKLEFSNNTANGSVLLTASVKGITSEGQGGTESLCLFAKSSTGTYTGKTVVKAAGGVIRWDQS
jgi:hypothetical protein